MKAHVAATPTTVPGGPGGPFCPISPLRPGGPIAPGFPCGPVGPGDPGRPGSPWDQATVVSLGAVTHVVTHRDENNLKRTFKPGGPTCPAGPARPTPLSPCDTQLTVTSGIRSHVSVKKEIWYKSAPCLLWAQKIPAPPAWEGRLIGEFKTNTNNLAQSYLYNQNMQRSVSAIFYSFALLSKCFLRTWCPLSEDWLSYL